MSAHAPHAFGEAPHELQEPGFFEVTENILTISHSLDAPQGQIEETLQPIFFAAGRYGIDDLVKIQIAEEFGDLLFVPFCPRLAFVKQNAPKRRG
jgi:hypothetical protein